MVLARQHIVSEYHSSSLIPRLSPPPLSRASSFSGSPLPPSPVPPHSQALPYPPPLCLLILRLSPTPSPVPPHSFFFGWGGGRHRGEAGNLYYYITCIQNHFSYLNILCLDVLTDSAWNSRADSWSQPVCLWHSLFLLCLLWPGG